MKLRKILLASTLSMALAITAAVPAFAETGEAVPISADADMPIMVQSQNIKTVLPKLTAKSYSYSKIKLSWDQGRQRIRLPDLPGNKEKRKVFENCDSQCGKNRIHQHKADLRQDLLL